MSGSRDANSNKFRFDDVVVEMVGSFAARYDMTVADRDEFGVVFKSSTRSLVVMRDWRSRKGVDVEISRMIPERKSLYPGEIDVGTVLRHFRKIPGVNFGALSIATEHDTRESLAVVVEVIASHFDDILVDDAPLLALMDDIRVLKAEDMREHNRRAKEARQRLRREGRL